MLINKTASEFLFQVMHYSLHFKTLMTNRLELVKHKHFSLSCMLFGCFRFFFPCFTIFIKVICNSLCMSVTPKTSKTKPLFMSLCVPSMCLQPERLSFSYKVLDAAHKKFIIAKKFFLCLKNFCTKIVLFLYIIGSSLYWKF